MILRALRYIRFEGEPREWCILGADYDRFGGYVYFENMNLLVGKNASGKSRTLAVIRIAAELLSGRKNVAEVIYATEKFDLLFEDDGKQYNYIIEYKNHIIINEKLTVDGKIVLSRKDKYIIDRSGQKVNLYIDDIIPAVTTKDNLGKCYFIELFQWGRMQRNFLFSNPLEKNWLVKDFNNLRDDQQDDVEDTGIMVYTFYRGVEAYGKSYISVILKIMQQIGYEVTNLEIERTKDGYGICIEEEGSYKISQREMSQGMFRALSLFIQLVYAEMSNIPICILVDDLGEGLDFSRTKEMTSIMIKKINHSNIQFFITTNDRAIMNNVPLRYLTVIDRHKKESIYYDYTNSKEIYEDFKYTGLSNFDFLTTDFYINGFGDNNE